MAEQNVNAEYANQRRHARLSSRREAFVEVPGGMVGVTLVNWSAGGARLEFEQPMDLQPEFRLLLGPKEDGGAPAVRCQLRWIDGTAAGVTFY